MWQPGSETGSPHTGRIALLFVKDQHYAFSGKWPACNTSAKFIVQPKAIKMAIGIHYIYLQGEFYVSVTKII